MAGDKERTTMTLQTRLLEDPRLAELGGPLMLRQRHGSWWLEVVNYPGSGKRLVRTPEEVTRLLELLGEDRKEVTGLSLSGVGGSGFKGWLSWSGLAWFTRLDLLDLRFGKAGLEALLACPHIAQLEHLSLAGCDIGKVGVGMLKQSDHLPGLRSLDLSTGDFDRTKSNSDALKYLVSEPKGKPHGATLRGLEALKLGRWDSHGFSAGLKALAASALGRGLRVLDLESHHTLGPGARELLHALAAAAGRLEELRLRHVFANYPDGSEDWNVGFTGEALVPLPTLRGLVLDDCALRAEQMTALAGAWFWPQLERLSLARGNFYPGALKPWATARAGLKELWLDDNEHLGREDVRALATYPVATTLERLGLKRTANAADLERLPASFLRAVEAGGGVAEE
jgi:hypothetical protein